MAEVSRTAGGVSFPYQKRSISRKGESFMRQCVDAAIDMTVLSYDDSIHSYRAARENKIINYDLVNGIVHKEAMYKITNPFGVPGLEREIQDYPLVRPRLNLLIGEEANRRFDFQCRVVNEDAISEKEKQIKQQYIERLTQVVFDEEYDEEEAKKKLGEIDKWRKYESQDLRERMSSQILEYLWHKLKLKQVFNTGFEDALIAGEEIYRVDIVSGEPVVRRVNPLNLYVVRTNDSNIIDDADVIVEDGYHNIGHIIDNYYEYLTDKDIDDIEKGSINLKSPSRGATLNYTDADPYPITGEVIEVDTKDPRVNRIKESPYDEYGRIRVSRVTWRSMRKVGQITSYDKVGRIEKRYVDEFYKPNKMLGEEVKWMWINEWWEGTRVGKDIYLKMGPRKIQYRRFTNRSVGSSGYVGSLYNINSTVTKSLMDIMRPYQYLYDEFMDRIKSAFEKFKGPMIELDFAKMPDEWSPEKWMHYAENMGYLIVDSFKEGRKGASTGKLAGGFNTTGKVLNPDLGNYIQHHVLMLQYIEKQIGIISGIPDQRLGEIENRETVGGVERAVNQSSHITEPIFSLHDEVKLRVLETLLETAKYAWKNDKKKMQYVLDDMSYAILDVDGEVFNEAEYGVFVTDGRESAELMQTMKQLAHAGIQNDKITFGGLLDIYTSPSISVMRRKIEEQENAAMERASEQAKAQQKAAEQALQAKTAFEDKKLEQEERKNVRDNQTKIAIAMLGKEGDTEVPDDSAKEAIEERKVSLAEDEQRINAEMEKRKQAEVERSNKANEAIARQKKPVSSN